jgi:uncharacterized membrane protein YbhN (UPF0104 family)
VFQVVCLTLVSWALLVAVAWLLLLALGLPGGIGAGAMVVVATTVALALPSAPAGLGVFEGVIVLVLATVGVAKADALSYALVLHAVDVLPYLFVATAVELGRSVAGAAGRSRSRRTSPAL